MGWNQVGDFIVLDLNLISSNFVDRIRSMRIHITDWGYRLIISKTRYRAAPSFLDSHLWKSLGSGYSSEIKNSNMSNWQWCKSLNCHPASTGYRAASTKVFSLLFCPTAGINESLRLFYLVQSLGYFPF